MTFLNGIVNLLSAFCSSTFLSFWLYPLLALAFIATVPAMIRSFTVWR